MRILTAFFIGVMVLFSAQAFSQDLSKDEIKQLKKEAKNYGKNPAALKQLLDEHRLYRKEKENLERQLAGIQSQQGQESDQLARKEQEVIDLNNRLMNAQATIRQLQNDLAAAPATSNQPGSMEDWMTGITYRVQIGAYKKLTSPAEAVDEMALEMDGGMQKIMIGQFRNLEQAKELMNYFKQIGLKDAWVVAYRDGVRVPLEQVR